MKTLCKSISMAVRTFLTTRPISCLSTLSCQSSVMMLHCVPSWYVLPVPISYDRSDRLNASALYSGDPGFSINRNTAYPNRNFTWFSSDFRGKCRYSKLSQIRLWLIHSTSCAVRSVQPLLTFETNSLRRYGMDGAGIESRWGRIFRVRPDRPCGPPSLLYDWYWVIPGIKVAGCDVNHPTISSAEGKGRTELHSYSFSAPSW